MSFSEMKYTKPAIEHQQHWHFVPSHGRMGLVEFSILSKVNIVGNQNDLILELVYKYFSQILQQAKYL